MSPGLLRAPSTPLTNEDCQVSQPNRRFQAVRRSPILWGAAASVGFYAALDSGVLGPQFFQRYCAGHPVEYVETILFFVGLAALLWKAAELAPQRRGLSRPMLGPVPEGGQAPADCPALLARLGGLPPSRREHYLVRRLRDGLEYVTRRDSAGALGEQLQHLADLDAERAHAGYGLVRLIVWAIPILGFLGTVIGITMAIASLRVDALEESMLEVTAGLGVAFDTTALALALSILLMFTQHYVDRAERELLAEVDRRVEAELVGRFAEIPAGAEGQVAASRRVAESMVRSLDDLLRRQTEQWRATVDAAGQRWAQTAEVLTRALEATGHVARLEETLNRNLAALAGAKNFEDTVISLAAAIHLLSTRLGPAAPTVPAVHLEGLRRTGRAA